MRNVFFGILLWTLYVNCKGLRDPCEGLEDGTRLPHSLQCDRFIICKNQRLSTVGRCPRGLHFNPRLSVCDLKQRARCDAVLVLPSSAMRSVASEGSSDCCSCCNCCNCAPIHPTCPDLPTFPDTPSPPDTCPTPGAPATSSSASTDPSGKGVCENQPDGAMFPDPGSNGYIICQCEREIPMPCPPNLIFNPLLKVCDWPKNTPGSSSTSSTSNTRDPSPSDSSSTSTDSSTLESSATPGVTSSTESSSTPSNSSPSDLSSTPIDSSTVALSTTTSFTSSTESDLTPSDPSPSDSSSTPRDSSNTDTSSTLNDTSTASTLSTPRGPVMGPSGTTCNNQGICESQPDGTMFPDSGSNGYIVCQCECEVAMPCPSGLIFNPVLKVCDWPNSVKPTPIVPSTDNSTPTGSSANVCNYKGKCEGQRDGTLFADPNTSGYIVCQGECEALRPCPVGLVFNPKVNVCDWPQAFV